MNRTLGLVIVILCASTQSISSTQAVQEIKSSEEIIQKLKKGGEGSGIVTRGLGSRNIVAVRKIDLVFEFHYDSDVMKSQSIPQLDELKAALQSSELRDGRFKIVGHTDKKGSAEYNLRLSERRALRLVKELQISGVSDAALQWEGKGFQELLNKDEPFAAENRRVQVIALD